MRRWIRFATAVGGGALALRAMERRFAAPTYRGAPSDHFDGRRFFNPSSGWQSERSFLRWQLERQQGFWSPWTPAPFGPPPVERVSMGALRVTFIGHATLLLQIDGVNILTDPIWSDRCSPVGFAGPKRHRPPGIRFEDLPRIDAVLVSHNHYDHLDVPTLRRLEETHRPMIVTPLANGAILKRAGISNVTELDWWQSVSHGVEITAVPAQHFSARALSDRNACLWGGFVISGIAGHAYFAGDTGWGTHFDEIGRRYQPLRLAMLPIGAYLPRWFMHPAHISPVEAVDAHFALGAETSVAMHFGTFALGDDGEFEPVEELMREVASRGNPDFRVLGHGEGIDIVNSAAMGRRGETIAGAIDLSS